jgi:hypothetical protein
MIQSKIKHVQKIIVVSSNLPFLLVHLFSPVRTRFRHPWPVTSAVRLIVSEKKLSRPHKQPVFFLSPVAGVMNASRRYRKADRRTIPSRSVLRSPRSGKR